MRVVLFLLFMWSVSHMKDIRRTFEYHGAEHKTIFCYEAGEELTLSLIHISITKACRLSWKSSWHRAYPTPRQARAKTVRLFSLPIWTTTA